MEYTGLVASHGDCDVNRVQAVVDSAKANELLYSRQSAPAKGHEVSVTW